MGFSKAGGLLQKIKTVNTGVSAKGVTGNRKKTAEAFDILFCLVQNVEISQIKAHRIVDCVEKTFYIKCKKEIKGGILKCPIKR